MNRRSLLWAGLMAPLMPPAAFGRSPGIGVGIIDGRLMLAEAALGGRPVRAAVDTGARISAVSESLGQSLGIETRGSIRLNTASGEVRAPLARNVPFYAGRAGSLRTRWALVPDRLMSGVDCVVEARAFGDLVLSFSQSQLLDDASFPGGKSLSVRRAPIPLLDLQSAGTPLLMVLDSGAAVSWVTASTAERLAALSGVRPVTYDTASGPVLRALRLPSLSSGEADFEDIVVRVRPSEHTPRVAGAELSGLFGLDAMRLYDWRLHQGHRRVERSASASGRQEWIGLGIDFRSDAEDPGRVLGLARNGPASIAGLSVGDRILSLGGVAPGPETTAAMASVGSCGCVEDVAVDFESAGLRRTAIIRSAPLL